MFNTYDQMPEGFKFGCDPEVFLVNDENGEIVPASTFISGSKGAIVRCDGGGMHVDGFAAELNTIPADNFDEFEKNFQAVLATMKSLLPAGISICPKASVEIPQAAFDAAPPQEKELGCDPDFNAWTGRMNLPPKNKKQPRLRTGAGHIHVGFPGDKKPLSDKMHVKNCFDLVKQLDWHVGYNTLYRDSDSTRRSLYGKAGACRPKEYGVEYRVPSNFWAVGDLATRREVFNGVVRGLRYMEGAFMPEIVDPVYNDLLISSINTSVLSGTVQQVLNKETSRAYIHA
jgi:hypothetical protein